MLATGVISVDNRYLAQLENFRLKVFRSVAERLNFRKAAEHLFLTQPAVTLQIKALEDELGVRLFDRAANRVSLTPKGLVLLRYAKKIAALASKAEQELGPEDGTFSGELSIGVSTTIAQYVLPRLIGAFLAEHPRVQLSLHSGNTEQIVELLLKSKVALGLIEGPARNRGVQADAFMQDELVLITPPEFEVNHFSSQQLLASNLLMREQGSGSRRVVETALEKASLRLKLFKSVMNLDSTEAIKSAVEAGLGIGFVSRWAISKELELGAQGGGSRRSQDHPRFFPHFLHRTRAPRAAVGAFRSFALARGRLLSGAPRNTRPCRRSSSR